MWFVWYWIMSVILIYLMTKAVLKSDPNALEGAYGIYMFIMLIPFINTIIIGFCIYSLLEDRNMTSKDLAYKIFMVKKKK